MKKICVVTGSRAEYGLLRWVMEGIRSSPALTLQIIATGAHLSPEFGLTVNDIRNDGFEVDRAVEMLLSSDTPVGLTKSMGLGVIGFADALATLRPDLLLLLGDRYEIFAAASAATMARIPLAHLHGGETTEGAIDEAFRHSITKMSHLHFVAADCYRRRVIQLGERPEHVYLVGGLGSDSIARLPLLERAQLEHELGFTFRPRNLLITFHPVTLEHDAGIGEMEELLAALASLTDTGLLFTLPNPDTNARALCDRVRTFCATHSHARCYQSLGQLLYLSSVRHVDGVVGNSSSGLTEVPSLKKGTINIGDRQSGRLRGASVIDCEPNCFSIMKAIDHLYSTTFQARLTAATNPYGDSGASEAIVQTLERIDLRNLLTKRFNDLNLSATAETAGCLM